VSRPFIKQVAVGVVVYVSTVLVLELFVFVLSHIPPQAANLDAIIAPIAHLELALLWPKHLLRALWPGESTPRVLLWAVTLLNWLLWGVALALAHRAWRRLRD
jgi:hypothetical protein